MSTAPQPPKPPPDPLAVALAAIDPAPHGFDWNALMFAAGRESKARALALWRAAAGFAALAAAGLLVALLARPVVVRERVVYAPAPPAPPPAPAPEPPAPPAAPEPPWGYDAPAPGAAAEWLNRRAEIAARGLPALEPKIDPPPRRGD